MKNWRHIIQRWLPMAHYEVNPFARGSAWSHVELLIRSVFWALMAFLVYAWLMVILVDVLDWFAPFAVLEEQASYPAMMLFYFFGEALVLSPAPIENLQFVLLAWSAAFSLCLAIYSWLRKDTWGGTVFLLLSLGLALMYLNDAFNYRHDLVTTVLWHLYGPDRPPRGNVVSIIVEILFYAFIAIFMLGATVLWLRHCRKTKRIVHFGLVAFGAYFVASVGSATRHIGSWYDRWGIVIGSFFPDHFREKIQELPFPQSRHTGPKEFWIIDWWFEETIEYIGAAAFFVFVMLNVLLIWHDRTKVHQ